MADLREQRAAVKFCFLLGKTGTETLERHVKMHNLTFKLQDMHKLFFDSISALLKCGQILLTTQKRKILG